MADAQGRVTVLEVYRCDHPGCSKLFQSRGALHTHQVSSPLKEVFPAASANGRCLSTSKTGLAQAPTKRRADVHGSSSPEAIKSKQHGRDAAEARTARRYGKQGPFVQTL